MSNTIKIGTNNINAIKLGSVDVDAVYLGTNLVYTSTPPTPSSKKLQLTYSDSSTYDIDCDTATTLTQSDVQGGSGSYTAITSAVVGDCITSIDTAAFNGCSGLTTCTIGSGVTSIGERAFRQCSGLTSIDIPNSVISIGNSAFWGCNSLTSIDIPSGVTSIDNSVFQNCSGLTSCTIGSGVTTIGTRAFRYCNSLTSIDIPSSITSIGDGAFQGCSGLTSIDIPNSVTSIGSGMCSGCTSLVTCTIGSGVTSISNSAFRVCSSLTSINIPSGVTSIGGYAFASCSGLTSIDIPSGVTSIGYYTFNGCSSLTSINIPSGVTSISSGAFYNCSGLTSVTVNASTPPTLGTNVFNNTNDCPIYVPAASVDVYKSSWSDYASRIQAIPTPPQSSCYEIVSIPITSYTSTTYDSVYSASDEKWYMKNNLNQYEEYGIYETGTSLSDFTYYDGKLTVIGTTEYQWDGSQWQNVGVYETSETTWTIDDDSSEYQGETLLTSFKIPKEDISEIGYLDLNIIEVSGGRLRIYSDNYTYENDDSGVFEEGTVTDDGTYLNYSLPTTKEVVVENIEYWNPTPIHLIMGDKEISVEYSAKTASANEYQSVAEMEAVGCPTVGVGQYGFVGNDIYKYTNNEEWIGTSLQDPKMVAFYSSGTPLVVYNDSDTTLSSGETKASTLPIEVYVGNSVVSIGDSAFQRCSSLTSIDIPNSVTSIGRYAFDGCSGLTSIDIPNSVVSIGDSAFQRCSSLTSIDIPNSVTSISSYAFNRCYSLTSIDIPNSVTSIGRYAFDGCSGLTSIDIPNSVVSIGDSAFSNTPWWNSYSADTSHQYGNIIYINDVAYKATSTGITSCTFKEGSLSIGGGAFISCKRLTSVNIPNSVTSIGDGAFISCSGLTSIDIPNSVTSIGAAAFFNCSSLSEIKIYATEPPTLGVNAFYNTSCPIYVPAASVEAYKSSWSDYASRIQAIPT